MKFPFPFASLNGVFLTLKSAKLLVLKTTSWSDWQLAWQLQLHVLYSHEAYFFNQSVREIRMWVIYEIDLTWIDLKKNWSLNTPFNCINHHRYYLKKNNFLFVQKSSKSIISKWLMILSKREQFILSYSQTNGMHTLLVPAVGYTHRLSLKIITYLIYICISNSKQLGKEWNCS